MSDEVRDSFRVSQMLADAGFAVDASDLEIECRGGRWIVRWLGNQLAWLPDSDAGAGRLATDRRVLRLLGARCDFSVPRVLAELPGGGDVRAMVQGMREPWRLAGRLSADPALSDRLGRKIGSMLAQQHGRIVAADVAGWLRTVPTWPEAAAWMRSRLPAVIDDRQLLDDIEVVIAQWECLPTADADRALIHGDLGLHNLAIDETSGDVRGLFDHDDAAWADRHYDFRYLAFDLGRSRLLDAALETYGEASGRVIDRGRVMLLNAASAICFLAFRCGVAPEQNWCGRTLAEDLAWVRWSMDQLNR